MVTNVNQRSISGKKYSDSCSCSVLWVDKSCHIFCGDLFVNKYYFSADSFIDKSILLGFFGKETLKCTVALTAYKDWTVRHQDVRQAKVKAREITDTLHYPPTSNFLLRIITLTFSLALRYLAAAILGAVLFNEWLVYTLQPITWRRLQCDHNDTTCIKVLFVADPQIQGDDANSWPLNKIFSWDSDRYFVHFILYECVTSVDN